MCTEQPSTHRTRSQEVSHRLGVLVEFASALTPGVGMCNPPAEGFEPAPAPAVDIPALIEAARDHALLSAFRAIKAIADATPGEFDLS